MIGYYDYTVILTYISLISAGIGIMTALNAHPLIATTCLIVSGICDAFDGKVASIKKDRTDSEKSYGIQIDSLTDMVAFGVLPATIGAAILKKSAIIAAITDSRGKTTIVAFYAVLILYILAAMIRLAYYNVSELERQKVEKGPRKYYTGLPVTCSAVIFPFIMLVEYFTRSDLSIIYLICVLLTALAFISPVKIPKLNKSMIPTIVCICAIGAIVWFAMIAVRKV